MNFYFGVILFIIGMSGSAWASLGENEKQLIERYGKEKSLIHLESPEVSHDIIFFNHSGFQIMVDMFNGVSSQEQFTKTNGDSITKQEVKILLDENVLNHAWKQKYILPPNLLPGGQWKRDDGAIAIFTPKLFVVTSKELHDAEMAIPVPKSPKASTGSL